MKISHKFLVLLFLCLFMIGQVICPRYKIYAAKTTSVWQKVYWGSNSDIAYSIQQTTDGGYIVAGYTSSFGAEGEDIYIIKTDSLGDTEPYQED